MVRRGLPALGLFLTTAGFIVTKTGRDALYVQDGGIYALPWAYLGIAALAPGFAVGMLTLIRWLGMRRARVLSLLAMGVFQLFVATIARPGGDPVMTTIFMLIPLVYGVLLSAAWLLGSELLEGVSSAARAKSYAIFGAASMAGGTVGAGLARLLGTAFEPQLLFAIGAVGLALAAGVLEYAHRQFPLGQVWKPTRQEARLKGVMPSIRETAPHLGHPYIRSLLWVAVASGFVGVFIEFLFFYSVATGATTGKENSVLFSGLYLTLTAGSLILQLTLTPVLQHFVGVRGSLLVLPVALAAGSVATIVGGAGLGYFALRVLEGSLKSSVHRSNWEQTYGPLSPSERSVVKVLIEGLGVRMAEGLAGLVIVVWLLLVARQVVAATPQLLNLTLVVGVIGWLISSLVLFRSIGSLADSLNDLPVESCGHPPGGCPITAVLGDELVRRLPTSDSVSVDSDDAGLV